MLNAIFEDSLEVTYWSRIWQRLVAEGHPDSWVYRWTFTCLANGGLTALPNRNLVNNVGFGEDATHTTGGSINTSFSEGIDPNQHPSFLLRDAVVDHYTFDHVFGGKWQRFPLLLIHLSVIVSAQDEKHFSVACPMNHNFAFVSILETAMGLLNLDYFTSSPEVLRANFFCSPFYC